MDFTVRIPYRKIVFHVQMENTAPGLKFKPGKEARKYDLLRTVERDQEIYRQRFFLN